MKKIFKIAFCIIIALVVALYLGIVFLLPPIINSKTTINKLQSLILAKTGTQTTITGLNLKISPKFLVVLNVADLDAKNNNVSVANIKNLAITGKLLQKELTLVRADNIFIDGNYLKQFKKEQKKKNNGKLKLNSIPEIHIKKLVFKSNKANINAENIDTANNLINLKASVSTPFFKEILKLGDSGSLEIAEDKLHANKFEITLGNSHLYLDGILTDKNKSPDFDIIGEKLPASEIMATILQIQKAQDSSRRFIENFNSFKGTVNVNLKLDKDGIWGTCVGNNLAAKAWFDIPLFFKEAVFNFRGKTVDSVAEGTLGHGKVIHTLNITDLLTPEKKLVIGTMDTTLTKNFDYVPNLTVLNAININLVYKIKLKKPDVYYNIDIPANSDLIFNSFDLGLRDYKRKIYANTLKDNNDLRIKEYKYSYSAANKENIIISGDGLFIKNIDKTNPDKFVPQYLTIRTNGYAPTSVIGAFREKVSGGEFKGDLKYDFAHNQVLGTFDIQNTRHKAFRIDRAHVVSKNGVFNITSDGLYKGEKYQAELTAKNNIFGKTLIYDMKLFLDKLTLKSASDTNKRKKPDPTKFRKKFRDLDLTINNWEITINEIKRDKLLLENVKLIGSLKNHIFDFKMNDLNFADGVIRADGIYNFAKDTSKMKFEAENINSNKVAEMTINLKDQVEGIANAKLDIDSKNMFKFLDAHCDFQIKEGFLPKLGDTEFMIDNAKFKLSEITNFDLSQKDLMKDDIVGSFDVHNTELNNINLTTWHRLSAVYLEGSYEMEKQYADLHLFWAYSKEAPKGIRIFGIPLSLILKVVFRPEHTKEEYKTQLSKIPAISSDEKNTNYYRIYLNGDINNSKVNLVLKEIK